MIPKGFYQHYKGGIYLAFGFGRHSETKEEGVFYLSAKYRSLWFRPASMWLDMVGPEADTPRFRKLGWVDGAFAFVDAMLEPKT